MFEWSEEKGPGWVEKIHVQHVNGEVLISTEYYYEPENEYIENTISMPLEEFRKFARGLRTI